MLGPAQAFSLVFSCDVGSLTLIIMLCAIFRSRCAPVCTRFPFCERVCVCVFECNLVAYMQVVHRLTSDLGREVVLGSTHMLTAENYVDDLMSMSEMEDVGL